jgi:ParB-like chromosome segregation protein Spo0J
LEPEKKTMKYDDHPIAAVFPLMTGSDFEELKASIKANGQQLPCTLFEGEILDGRNRYRACFELGIECKFETPEIADPFEYVAAMNLARRNLTISQRGVIAAEMANMKSGSRTDLEPRGNCPEVSLEKAAQIMGVSRTTAVRGRRVLRQSDPETISEIKAGHKTISAEREKLRRKASWKNNSKTLSAEDRKAKEEINRAFVKSMTPSPEKMEKEFRKLLIKYVSFYVKKVILHFPKHQREKARITLIELMQTRAEELVPSNETIT